MVIRVVTVVKEAKHDLHLLNQILLIYFKVNTFDYCEIKNLLIEFAYFLTYQHLYIDTSK